MLSAPVVKSLHQSRSRGSSSRSSIGAPSSRMNATRTPGDGEFVRLGAREHGRHERYSRGRASRTDHGDAKHRRSGHMAVAWPRCSLAAVTQPFTKGEAEMALEF